MRIGTLFMVAALLVSAGARAQADGPAPASAGTPRFALVSGETVATGADMMSGKFGWPGISFGYTHGLSDTFDVGVDFDLLYSVEGTTTSYFGIQLGVPLRKEVLRRDKLSVQVFIAPGLTIYTTPSTSFGFNFPVGGVLGVQVTPELRIGVGADFVMKVFVTNGAFFEFSPIFGPAVEYYVDKNLAVSLDTRFGPVIYSVSGAQAQFSFRTQVGVAYRM